MIEPKASFTVFTVTNLAAAEDFYTRVFGFQAVFSNSWYLHLVSASGIQVAFLLPDQPTQPSIFKKPYEGNGVIFSLEVEDANSAYEKAKSLSLNIALELRSEEWGQKHFCIKDPNGVFVDVVQPTQSSEEYQSDYKSS